MWIIAGDSMWGNEVWQSSGVVAANRVGIERLDRVADFCRETLPFEQQIPGVSFSLQSIKDMWLTLVQY